ncbi:lipoyl protein ligase domain-containing protein [Flaviflexus huanghaiensis]|uniref:lipoyl protein ligase domain-containing protein n=1 Tax=Flaviflexus huanghaiensis TaxID=1111473 RepID=UPI0015FB5F51|nr:lipoate--protein ligase family protein [Flaviflexus huanghaiensis]
MHGEYKEPGHKLVVVDLEVKDGQLFDVQIAGDFFLEPDSALTRMTEAIEGLPADSHAADVAQAITEVLKPTDELFGISPRGVATAVRRALGHSIDWGDIDFEVIRGPVVSPMMNVAMDETLVEDVAAGRRKPFMRIWEWDSPCVVIGSFQSVSNEIDWDGMNKHGVTLCRRVTGGGAMFMEAGNCITYSLVVPTALVDGMSFKDSYPFLDEWVMEALDKVGVKAHYVPLNDITSDKGKIGGAAQKHFASGVMVHHVTMSYDIDAQKMLDCIRIGKEKVRDKGLRSSVKRVDPMKSQTGMAREDIIEVFLDHFATKYGASKGEITESDIDTANERCETKFDTEEWTFRLP